MLLFKVASNGKEQIYRGLKSPLCSSQNCIKLLDNSIINMSAISEDWPYDNGCV